MTGASEYTHDTDTSAVRRGAATIVMDGAGKARGGRAQNRVVMAMAVIFGIYAALGGRLVHLAMQEEPEASLPAARVTASRPDLVDRNGEVLATDIKTASLFAEPRRIVDIDEAIEKLSTVLPDLNYQQTYRRLDSDAGFVWLRRQLSPRQQADILALGIPGLGFRTEKRRFYPGGPTASHIVGLVNIDNKGIAGIEKFVDDQGLADLQATGLAVEGHLEPVRLSLDLRVQHIIRDELVQALDRYKAIAAGAVVLNARTGEVVGMGSVPDYDPNNPVNALDKDRLNRMSAGVFEMGSTFKLFTTAMALDSGLVSINDSFDATRPIRIGGFTINDFHGKRRVLSVPEIFIYSSNIGTAKMADVVGIDGHRAFLQKIGLLGRLPTELPEVALPTEPKTWKKINSITISYGHGMATTPLQTAVAAAAMLNGGKLFPPTFLPRTEAEANEIAEQVISPKTSAEMRYLFRLNTEKGSGRRAEVEGYYVGGKTGTAEKVVNGRYSNNVRFNAYIAGFPADDPDYVVLVFVDEPKPERDGISATAGMNAAPMVRNIIRRSAPLLGVKPEFGQESNALLVSQQ
ncbi:penicillin-binding protein 2 [Nitratireductor aquimarinus]|uniref:peptidoglycan D,D-transpeptidase FtsI family protein n=1 Tax=Alphaproteobacteria TaxID=28211 RepID=UPI000DDF5582|nr:MULTISPECIES: penicillin-binding protein 2 [Alphaproteobacteria]MBY6022199.1 penicillin-binding protein 2 [Nitratireductor sp. DP7N14-4]MBN7757410.1 penicillin-binding protein 2 [Nitratireductor aquimarinus]MBY6000170.1 penicillin-binding protein 2 [Tritonibacter mobilis]MCV0380049.1 penicillin-binding protein 2 [Nitratireductor sp.]MDJ1462645.1 penicillin-binding protein 2 [Nitratireductor sp. GZWM139]